MELTSAGGKSVVLDRKHRFEIGDRVRPLDAVGVEHATVTALTLRVERGVAFPTYSLAGASHSEIRVDVPCTPDLIAVAR